MIKRFKTGPEKLSNILSWSDSFPRTLIFVMLSSTLFSTGTKYGFVLKKIEKYERILSIATPFVSNETVANFKKDFALIESSNDYEALMNNIANVIPKENIKIPQNIIEYFDK